jgi:hypothetical protein
LALPRAYQQDSGVHYFCRRSAFRKESLMIHLHLPGLLDVFWRAPLPQRRKTSNKPSNGASGR